jgi:hypothetical protein
VQAVEQQDGRFLERDLRTGFWYPVQYKRAVDKTSQGLRERDRDESNGGGNNEAKSDDDETAAGSGGTGRSSEPFAVPESFSGKSKTPPNLRDLAQVAIDSANRDLQASQSYSKQQAWPPPRAAVAAQAPTVDGPHVAHQPQQPRQPHQMHPAGVPLPASDNRVNNVYAALKRPSPPPTSHATGGESLSTPPPSLVPAASRGSSRLSEDDLTPLPPTMQMRESSMFRMLKHTQLLPKPSSLPRRTSTKDLSGSASPPPSQHRGQSIVAGSYNRRLPKALNIQNIPFSAVAAEKATTAKTKQQAALQPYYNTQYGEAPPPHNAYAMYPHPAPSYPPPHGLQPSPLGYDLLHRVPRHQPPPLVPLPQRNQPKPPSRLQREQSYTRQAYSCQPPSALALASAAATAGSNGPPDPHAHLQQHQQQHHQQQHHQQQHQQQQQQHQGHAGEYQQQQQQQHQQQFIPTMEYGQEQQLAQTPTQNTGSPAPALTRFTSQVSDWLNSFWPTDSANAGRQTSAMLDQENLSQGSHAESADLPPPDEPIVPSISMSWTTSSSTIPNSNPSRKRKAHAALPRLPYGVRGSSGIKAVGNDPSSAALDGLLQPTELEHGVSATLLKMAGAPSKLFSGLTSFFSDRGISASAAAGTTNNMSQTGSIGVAQSLLPITPAAVADEMGRGSSSSSSMAKKSQASLLDDYEESPMEARLRTVQYA